MPAISLSPFERFMLSSRLRDLAEKEGSDSHETHAQIIEEGYTSLYGEVFGSIGEPELDSAAQEEVFELLGMFRALHGDRMHPEKWNPSGDRYYQKFRGFDGNGSGGRYAFARFLMEKLGRFEESKGEYNSHSSHTLDTYRSMYQRWLKLGKPQEMTEPQIDLVVSAKQAP